MHHNVRSGFRGRIESSREACISHNSPLILEQGYCPLDLASDSWEGHIGYWWIGNDRFDISHNNRYGT